MVMTAMKILSFCQTKEPICKYLNAQGTSFDNVNKRNFGYKCMVSRYILILQSHLDMLDQ